MGRAKRNPSNSFRQDDGFRNGSTHPTGCNSSCASDQKTGTPDFFREHLHAHESYFASYDDSLIFRGPLEQAHDTLHDSDGDKYHCCCGYPDRVKWVILPLPYEPARKPHCPQKCI
jgi:hypothetical protein